MSQSILPFLSSVFDSTVRETIRRERLCIRTSRNILVAEDTINAANPHTSSPFTVGSDSVSLQRFR